MNSITVGLYLIVGVIFVLKRLFKKRRYHLPPGPNFFWSLWTTFSSFKHLHYVEYSKKYNSDIIFLQQGEMRVIVLNSFKAIRTAFTKRNFAGRPNFEHITQKRNQGTNRGIGFSQGQAWLEQRTFALKFFLRFIRGPELESIIIEESSFLLLSSNSQLSGDNIFSTVFNVMWRILASERIRLDHDLHNHIRNMVAPSGEPRWLRFFPTIRNIKRVLNLATPSHQPNSELQEYLTRVLERHVRDLEEGASERDFIHAFLEKIQETTDETSSFYKAEGGKNLLVALKDLIYASTTTVSNTILWTLHFLSIYQNVQIIAAIEILQIFGDGEIDLKKCSMLNYLRAVITESIRLRAHAPLGMPHCSLRDDTIEGIGIEGNRIYNIPKSTIILANLHAVMHNEGLFKNPDTFDPARFLNENGDYFQPREFCAFGFGTRFCLGSALSSKITILILAQILQKFEILPPRDPGNDFCFSIGTLLVPRLQQVNLQRRGN